MYEGIDVGTVTEAFTGGVTEEVSYTQATYFPTLLPSQLHLPEDPCLP